MDNGANSSFSTQNNVWYHAVGVRNVVTKLNSLYVNGMFDTAATENPTVSANSSNLFYIGTVSGQARHFNGLVSNVKIYNKILTNQEILQNFNATRSRYGL